MRYLLIYLSTLILFLSTITTSAQMVKIMEKPSFYHGKRSTINFNLGLQPTISPMSSTAKTKPIGLYANVKPELTYTLAVSNQIAFYAKGSFLKSSREEAYSSVYVKTSPTSSQSYEEVGKPSMKGNSIGGGISFFRNKKAAIAPMGKHFSIGFFQHKYNVTYENMTLISNRYSPNPTTYDLSNTTSSFKYHSIEMSFANNQPITKNLYYQLGFSTSFHTTILEQIQYSNASDDIDGLEDQLNLNNLQGLSFRDLMVLRMGFGYVIF